MRRGRATSVASMRRRPRRSRRSRTWKVNSNRPPPDMALHEITSLLGRVALDRDTKLQILAVLAANPDPKATEDIETLLRSYEEMETKERTALMERLRAVDEAYQAKVKTI